LTDDELDDKFTDCLSVPGAAWNASLLLSRLRNLHVCTNIRDVFPSSVRELTTTP
jgi:hypothetical protein